MPLDVASLSLAHGLLLAVAATLLAVLYPAWKIAAASAAPKSSRTCARH